MSLSREWTIEDLAQLRELAGTIPNEVIAERIGRTRNAVRLRIAMHGLTSMRSRWKRHNCEVYRETIIAQMATGASAFAIGQSIGKTAYAVWNMARQLGLTFGRRVEWTRDEQLMLMELASVMSVRQLSDRLGRAPVSIRVKAKALGIALMGGSMRLPWSSDELVILRAEAGSGKGAREIARLCGKSHTAVYHKASELGLSVGSSHWWSKEDEEFLSGHGSTMTAGELMERLNRHHKAIRAKAKAMGIPLRPAAISRPVRERIAKPVVDRSCARHGAAMRKHVSRPKRPARAPSPTKPTRRSKQRNEAASTPRLAWCEVCGAPVCNTIEGWAGHRQRIGCIRIARVA